MLFKVVVYGFSYSYAAPVLVSAKKLNNGVDSSVDICLLAASLFHCFLFNENF